MLKVTFFFKCMSLLVYLFITPMSDLHAQVLTNTTVKSGYLVSAEGAWCWFADPRAIRHERKDKNIDNAYIGYIDVHGNIKAMQYDFLRHEQTEVLVRSYFQPDDHNNPTFLVLPDDRVIVFYSRHTDEKCFYYRITKRAGDLRTLGDEKKLITDHNTTYPSAFILSGDSEHIYLCWRGINWHPTIAQLTLPDTLDNIYFSWGPYQMIQSTGARPYAKYLSNGSDKIYIAYTTGHPDNEQPNFLYFNFFDIHSKQLKDVEGNVLSKVDEGTFHVNKTDNYIQQYPKTVIDNSGDRDWIWQIVQDKEGHPRLVYVRISSDKKTHNYYYAYWSGTQWRKTFLANGGGPFHQTENLEMCYSAGLAIDPLNPNIVYPSLPVKGKNGDVYEIFKFTLNGLGEVKWKEQITQNSVKNNVRPYIISSKVTKSSNVLWMAGDYYDWIVSKERPGYPTEIRADFAPLVSGKAFLKRNSKFKNNGSNSDFTILATVVLDPIKGGTLIRSKDISFDLGAEDLYPNLVVKGIKYKSTNMLATADSWLKVNRGTNGKWYDPVPLKELLLAITYKDNTLRTYINGLLDQTIYNVNIEPTRKNDRVFSDFKLKSEVLYDRSLTPEEINVVRIDRKNKR